MEKQTAGREKLGDFANKFAQLNDDVLFGEVWSREDKLSLKIRTIITVTALVSKGFVDDSLKYHIQNAKNNGVSKEEMAEIITHIAFYAGWPNAWAAFNIAKEVYKEDDLNTHGGFLGLGEKNTEYEKYFIGTSYLKQVAKTTNLSINNVTFEPRCRNNWHIHHSTRDGGQILICISGNGLYQEEGKEVKRLKEGDVVVINPNVKHWHGATPNGWFSHIAIEVPGENTSNEWLEPVSDEYYDLIAKEESYD